MFGFGLGMLLVLFSMFLLQYFTHFTIGILLSFLIKEKVEIALVLFALMVWVTGIIAIISLFI
jgi:hypothetical protein